MEKEWFDCEVPQRRIYVDGFYIDKYPVTNEQYGKFIRATGHEEPEAWEDSDFIGPKQPVIGVIWEDAVAYCEWAGKRLPTEVEWEKAARGVDGRKYPWGNEWDNSKLIWAKNSGEKTHPVDRVYHTHQSPYGAVDMSGNVWEWVHDWFDGDYYTKAPERNPQCTSSGDGRVVRGGSWDIDDPAFFRAAYRSGYLPDLTNYFVGFRCAKTP